MNSTEALLELERIIQFERQHPVDHPATKRGQDSKIAALELALSCLRLELPIQSRKKKVYIAGPYTLGDVAQNVHVAIQYGNSIANLGLIPYIPHLNHFWQFLQQRPYEFWMQHGLEFLPLCDVVFRIDGESAGSDREVQEARKLGIPVYTTLQQLIDEMDLAKPVHDPDADLA